MKGFLKEFETFAVRGNAIDLAVGVVIGAAFAQITNSLVNHILTPLLSFFVGGFDFSKLTFALSEKVSLQYGLFLQALLNFILIAFVLFLFVKFFNNVILRRRAEQPPPPAETEELKVLKEIRDRLRA